MTATTDIVRINTSGLSLGRRISASPSLRQALRWWSVESYGSSYFVLTKVGTTYPPAVGFCSTLIAGGTRTTGSRLVPVQDGWIKIPVDPSSAVWRTDDRLVCLRSTASRAEPRGGTSASDQSAPVHDDIEVFQCPSMHLSLRQRCAVSARPQPVPECYLAALSSAYTCVTNRCVVSFEFGTFAS